MYLLMLGKMMLTNNIKEIKEIVYSYIEDVDSLEDGINTFCYEDDSIAIEIECKNSYEIDKEYGDYYTPPTCSGHGEVTPISVIVYPLEEDGECKKSYDITNEFSTHYYKF